MLWPETALHGGLACRFAPTWRPWPGKKRFCEGSKIQILDGRKRQNAVERATRHEYYLPLARVSALDQVLRDVYFHAVSAQKV